MKALTFAPDDTRAIARLMRDVLPCLWPVGGWKPGLDMSDSIIWTRDDDRMCFFATPWWDGDGEGNEKNARSCDTAWCDNDDGDIHLAASYDFPAPDAPLDEILNAYRIIVNAMIAQRDVFVP